MKSVDMIQNINKISARLKSLNDLVLALSEKERREELDTLDLILIAKENGLLTNALSITYSDKIYNYSKSSFINDKLYENLALWNKNWSAYHLSRFILDNYVVDLNRNTTNYNYQKPVLEVLLTSINEIDNKKSNFYDGFNQAYNRLDLVERLVRLGKLDNSQIEIIKKVLNETDFANVTDEWAIYKLNNIKEGIINYKQIDTIMEKHNNRKEKMREYLNSLTITEDTENYINTDLHKLVRSVKTKELYK